jgi:dipeptidyl aminopeptidase/acylaminoacyl peptidase
MASLVLAQGADNGIRNAAGSKNESLSDGSTGRVVEFRSSDGTYLPAYIRRPSGHGPFPVIVLLHGGAANAEVTYALGRTTEPPAGDFVAAGWAVLTIDFRAKATVRGIEWDDTKAAIDAVRQLPLIDGNRVALFGGSHGAGVISRLASRVDVRCGVLCAPAAIDLIEISKAVDRGVEVVGVLKKMIADAETRYGVKLSEVEKDPAHYGYESALTEASKVRFPIMIINGRNDTSSPTSVVQAYADRLRASGKKVETYFPEDGRHGFYFGFMDNRNSGKPPNFTPETREAGKRATAFVRKHFAQ